MGLPNLTPISKHMWYFRVAIGSVIGFLIYASLTDHEPFNLKSRRSRVNVNEKIKTTLGNEKLCVPPLPLHIIQTPFSLLPQSSKERFEGANERLIERLQAYGKATNDTLAIAVVHGDNSGGEELFWWGKGRVKLNNTGGDEDEVSRDSIFRIASVTKVFTVLQGLILQERSNTRALKHGTKYNGPRLAMEDDVRLHLEGFKLPAPFDQQKITLNMLGGHTAGLARDISVMGLDFDKKGILKFSSGDSDGGYSPPGFGLPQGNEQILNSGTGGLGSKNNGIVRISAPGKCRLTRRDDGDEDWHQCTKDELFELVKMRRLIWQPGEMVSYSNTGFDILGWALQSFASSFENGLQSSTDEHYLLRNILARDVFHPLGMNSSFFHPIPDHLKPEMTVPRSDNMVDLDFGEAYDPAGGMYSTPRDLSLFLSSLLSQVPTILEPATIRRWLKPTFPLPNGLSSVGIPWEIESWSYPSDNSPVYQLYGKGGALPGHYTHISVIPELGYGVVAFVAVGSKQVDIDNGAVAESNPDILCSIVHEELVSAVRDAYSSLLNNTYAGEYIQHPSPESDKTLGKASISFLPKHGILLLDSLITSNNVSLLRYLDGINPGGRNIYDQGGKLWPSGIEGEFRIRGGKQPESRPGRRSCREWFGFDETTTEAGWGVDKIVIRRYKDKKDTSETSGGLELIYEPLGVVFRKEDRQID